ncbi:hypothetical protein [Streptomyces sp. NBC_00470]|uniref:hypothetical protein n=1 Tax=Streptomyces sp. NBC_00470 TaxID=2975753 RepID=UPI0030E06374
MSRSTPFLPYVKIAAPSLGRSVAVTGLKVYLRENKHPVAQLDVLMFGSRYTHLQGRELLRQGVLTEGTPVQLSFGRSLYGGSSWCGYVLSAKRRAVGEGFALANQPRIHVTYMLTGCTHTMQSQSSRSWIASTRSYRSRDLIRSYGLRPHVQKSTVVQPGTAQNATSDFQFLVQMAEELGRRVVVDNSEVYVTSPLVTLRTNVAPPTFTYNDMPGIKSTLHDFQEINGSMDPEGGRSTRQESFGYNTATGHVSRVVARKGKSSAFTTLQTRTDNVSQALAAEDVSGAADDARLWVTANAEVTGDASLKPGQDVVLTGGGLDKSSRGLWMVKEAVHEFQLDQNTATHSFYRTGLVVGRDRTDGLSLVTRAHGLNETDLIASRTILRGGRWVSSYVEGRAS